MYQRACNKPRSQNTPSTLQSSPHSKTQIPPSTKHILLSILDAELSSPHQLLIDKRSVPEQSQFIMHPPRGTQDGRSEPPWKRWSIA